MVVFAKLASGTADEADGSGIGDVGRLGFEAREKGANQKEGTVEVDRVRIAPLREGHIRERDRSDWPNAVIDDEDLNRHLLGRSSVGEEALDIGFGSDVGLQGHSVRKRGQVARRGVVVRSNLGTGGEEGLCRLKTDA